MKFVLRDNTRTIDVAVLQAIASAIEAQLNEDVSPEFGGGYVVRVEQAVGTQLPDDEYELAIFQHSDQAGAAGYHATDNRGKPYGRVFLDAASGLTSGDFPLSGIASHEALEMAGDPGANDWVVRLDGKLKAKELSDQVEDTGYVKSDVYVSNFLTAAAFDPGMDGPYCFLDKQEPDKTKWLMSTGDSMTPGGYTIIASISDEGSVTGARVEASVEKLADVAWLAHKSHPASRSSRRGVVWPTAAEGGDDGGEQEESEKRSGEEEVEERSGEEKKE